VFEQSIAAVVCRARLQAEKYMDEVHIMRSTGTAYIFWFLLGAHYLYLGRVGTQIMLWLTMPIGIGFIWWFIDLFRIPGLVAEANRSLGMMGNTNTNTNVVNVNIDAETLRRAMATPSAETVPEQIAASDGSPAQRA